MELRQLRYFVAAAEEGSITRAAKRIFLTQPALSRQIKALEDEIGQRLLERHANSIRVTPAGQALLHDARELLRHADTVLERTRAIGRAVRLRVGYAPSLASGMLSAAVESFTGAHPGARVELLDLSTAEMLAALDAASLDVAITVLQEDRARHIRWTPLARAELRLAVPRAHPFARRKSVNPDDVAAQPLLALARRDYPEYWDLLTAWLRAHGHPPSIAGEYDGAESLMAAVESGLGVALVTIQMARLFPNRARLVSLSQPPGPISIAAGCRADRADEKPLAVFIQELLGAARRTGPDR